MISSRLQEEAQSLYITTKALFEKGEYGEALEYAETLLELSQENDVVELIEKYIKILNASKRFEEILELIENVLSKFPKHLCFLKYKAEILYNTNKFVEALKTCDVGIQCANESKRPDEQAHAGILNCKALVLMRLGKNQDASNLLDEAIELANRSDESATINNYKINKALLLYRTGNFSGSVELLSKITNSNRTMAMNLLLARSYHRQRLLDKASQEYTNVMKLNATSPNEVVFLSVAYTAMDSPASALRLLETLELNEPFYFIARGEAYLLTREHDKAKKDFEKALALSYMDPDAISGLGWALMGQNKTQEALSYIKNGLKLRPNDQFTRDLCDKFPTDSLPPEVVRQFKQLANPHSPRKKLPRLKSPQPLVVKAVPKIASIPNQHVMVTVPQDYSLFWSAVLGLLLPTLKDKAAFKTMFDLLFESEVSDSQVGIEEKASDKTNQREQAYQLLLKYNCQEATLAQPAYGILEKLVCETFRNRVITYMEKHFSTHDFERYEENINLTQTVTARLTHMREGVLTGGYPEMKAIAELSKTKIMLHSQDEKPMVFSMQQPTREMHLVHFRMNGSRGNHYQYCLPQNIYAEKMKVQPVLTVAGHGSLFHGIQQMQQTQQYIALYAEQALKK